jgi:hypothetical protein
VLNYDTRLGGYVVDLDRNRLQGDPELHVARHPQLGRPFVHRTYRPILDAASLKKTGERRPIGRRLLLLRENNSSTSPVDTSAGAGVTSLWPAQQR